MTNRVFHPTRSLAVDFSRGPDGTNATARRTSYVPDIQGRRLALRVSRRVPRSALPVALVFVALVSVAMGAVDDASPAAPVAAPGDALVARLHLEPFYKKCVIVGELPILASEKVSDAALREAAYLVEHVLQGRPDLISAMVAHGERIAVMAPSEFTTDIPEYREMKPVEFWNRRSRGMGGDANRPVVTCGEENLLNLDGDPYLGENILIHELAHAIHLVALKAVDPEFEPRLKVIFDQARAEGLWKGTYAFGYFTEYWAEGVQSWFDTNRSNDHDHNDIDTRDKLRRYDPRLASLIEEVFRQNEWRYAPTNRDPPRKHLATFDRAGRGV